MQLVVHRRLDSSSSFYIFAAEHIEVGAAVVVYRICRVAASQLSTFFFCPDNGDTAASTRDALDSVPVLVESN